MKRFVHKQRLCREYSGHEEMWKNKILQVLFLHRNNLIGQARGERKVFKIAERDLLK